MDEAGDEPVAVERGDALLEAADQQHAALHLHQLRLDVGGALVHGHGGVVY